MRRRVLGLLIVLSTVGCSLTANHFSECDRDLDCGPSGVCSQHYCLPLPDGCHRDDAASAISPFELPERIPIGVLLPLTTAPDAGNALAAVQLTAMQLAVSEANRRGLDGYRYGMFVCDTVGSADNASAQTGWLVDNLGVPALVVSGDEATLACANQASRTSASTYVISPDATTDALTTLFATDGNVWRVAPPDSQQNIVLANRLKADFPDLANTRICVGYSSAQATAGKGLVSTLKGMGFALIMERSYEGKSSEQKTKMLTDFANFQPRATVLLPESAIEARDLIVLAKTRTELLHANGHRWYFTGRAKGAALLTTDTQTELEQAVGTAVAQDVGGAFLSFQDSLKARTGVDPAGLPFVSHSYDALWLLMLASSSTPNVAQLSGSDLKDGMSRLSKTALPATLMRADSWKDASAVLNKGQSINAEGSSSAVDFTSTGAVRAPIELWQVSAGSFQVIERNTP